MVRVDDYWWRMLNIDSKMQRTPTKAMQLML